jgi:D-glycero-alpha-D-manno-heptose 1-phosphate guanylyltransferase
MTPEKEAVLLVGGLGTRLGGLIGDLPKPLAPVGGRPFLAWMLDSLAEQGFWRVILATGYRGDQVEAMLGTSWRGMAIEYSRETQPLGTGGAIALAARRISADAFFVMNGDTWLRLDYTTFDKQARESNARLGIALTRVDDVERYGAVRVEGDKVAGFVEKGSTGPGYINAGVYRVRRDLLPAFPQDAQFSFETQVLVPTVARESVFAYTDTSGFIDIGVPEDYARAQHVIGAERNASS